MGRSSSPGFFNVLLTLVSSASAADHASCAVKEASLFQKAAVRRHIRVNLSAIEDRNQFVSVYDAGGPQRLIGSSEDPFFGSMRAMEEFDKNVTDECSKKYGKQMLESLRRTTHAFCIGPSSNVTCHERVPFDVPRYMCELRHVEISSTGTRAEGCQVPIELQNMTLGASESLILKKLESQAAPLNCTSSISEDALIQMPWDTHNFYEWYGDWITLWETLAALEWQPKDVQLFLVEPLGNSEVAGDEQPFRRPFNEAWPLAFEKERVHMGNFQTLFGSGICFSRAVVVPHGGLSTTTFHGGRGGRSQCASPTIMASVLYLEALVNPLPTVTPPDKQVTLLLRKGTRSFQDDAIAEESARSALLPGWSLKTFRPEEYTCLREQLALVAQTSVLIGTHGAGLTHLMFLPPRARVVEIFCGDRSSDNRHYANLGTMSDGAAPEAPGNFHLEASFSSCRVDSSVVRRAIEEYEEGARLATESVE
mmetsp:Transcript_13555/g.23359  ORF Transcript_13555/g.23359 Transcript_13555/m.23359 type:complete len:480 (-) Transcript_13555:227-1666(-)